MRLRRDLIVMLAGLAGCAAPAPPPPPPEPEPPPVFEFPYAEVWTASPRVSIVGETAVATIERPATRLRVIEADPAGVRVDCGACPGAPEGRVAHADLVYEPRPPELAAAGRLADFALAVRTAAAAGDTAALRPVMAARFTSSLLGPAGIDAAFAAWAAEDLRPLRSVPVLLDRGLATRDSGLWAAPPEFLDAPDYQGPRLGFRRGPSGRWEWLFLIQAR